MADADNTTRSVLVGSEKQIEDAEKAVKIAGIGADNLRKIPVNDDFSMNTEKLNKQIIHDIKNGFQPLAVVRRAITGAFQKGCSILESPSAWVTGWRL